MSDDFVTVMTATNAQEARIVQAILRAAGIPAVVEGDSLTDEWAVTQKLIGQVAAEVKVPRSDLERAKKLIAEAKAEGVKFVDDHPEDEEEAPEPANLSWPTSARFSFFLLCVLFVVTAAMFIRTELDRRALLEDPLFRYEYNFTGTVMTQTNKKTGRAVAKYFDMNASLIWERSESLDREGRVTWVGLDTNEEGSSNAPRSTHLPGRSRSSC